MFDKELSDKFHSYLNETTTEELLKKAENAPPSGMYSIVDEYVKNLKQIEGSGIGVDLTTLPPSIVNIITILDNTESIDKETLKTLVSRVKDMKPLDPEFNKILNDNFLELF